MRGKSFLSASVISRPPVLSLTLQPLSDFLQHLIGSAKEEKMILAFKAVFEASRSLVCAHQANAKP